jgi:hypothetical protein
MLTKILNRGWPACLYLMVRYLIGILLLACLPIGLLLGWRIPGITGGLVRLANSERAWATYYLGLPAEPPMPPATARQAADVVTLLRDKSFRRSLRMLLAPLVAVPELFVAVAAISAVPSAAVGMAVWKISSGNVTLSGVDVSSWWEALTLGPLQTPRPSRCRPASGR